ncbi:MAG: pseudaminic acid biosynthesis-associated methylase [Patescibacteria group bacterium]
MSTEQERFWQSTFGDEYSDRNDMGVQALNLMYTTRYGSSRSVMNREFLSGRDISTIFEVGCNIGNQLSLLSQMGFNNLTGIEINARAVKTAKKRLPNANIIQGSALALPFPNNYFDLVFTAGVLIHIRPGDVEKAMAEIHRVSKRYIWGFEYFAPIREEIIYRGHKNRLWKTDFARLYRDLFPDLMLLQEKRYQYSTDKNIDSMFLLEKT